MDNDIKAIVLAAGRGTRIQTDGVDLPKVLRSVCGKPLLGYVLGALAFIEKRDIVIVAGYKKEDVMARFDGYDFAVQTEQLGTGHAVMAARNNLAGFSGHVLVCCGDMPLIRRETYAALIKAHISDGNDCTILTGTTSEPLPYGRIVRGENGGFLRVVEERDCTAAERGIRELNSGVYVFRAQELLPALSELKKSNAQGEYYLTDAPAILLARGKRVGICTRDLGDEIVGVNTPEQLRQVESVLRARGEY
jgi:UDP-N-acetylglucosamine diphosphorylase/glucosamine-1-phosphate N-acetyltransferase